MLKNTYLLFIYLQRSASSQPRTNPKHYYGISSIVVLLMFSPTPDSGRCKFRMCSDTCPSAMLRKVATRSRAALRPTARPAPCASGTSSNGGSRRRACGWRRRCRAPCRFCKSWTWLFKCTNYDSTGVRGPFRLACLPTIFPFSPPSEFFPPQNLLQIS